MIKYRLICAEQHEFDSWFADSAAYDALAAAGQLSCAVCGSPEVKKAIMAPAVQTRRARPPEAAAVAPAPSAGAPAAADAPTPAAAMSSAMPVERKMLAMMRAVAQHVRETHSYVGDKLPEEARKMHYGETEERPVYGDASRQDVEALAEEGIDLIPLPMPRDDA